MGKPGLRRLNPSQSSADNSQEGLFPGLGVSFTLLQVCTWSSPARAMVGVNGAPLSAVSGEGLMA